VAASQDLSRRLPSEGRDELSRLAASINTLLESLERAEVSQRQLVADASHELRTPLASLRTNVELLMGSGAGGGQGPSEPGGPVRRLDSEAKRQLAFDVVRQFDRVGTLVGDLVELARQDRRARVPAKLVELDLAALVGDVLDEQTVHHPEVEITSSLAAARVRGVAADLERVVANLVDNAAKWSPEGGVIEVTLRSGSTAQLTVRDHGTGIDPADLTHVFDRFYRGRSAGTVPGSGLGLAIVRRIVDVHNGTVAIESAPGRGTTVEVHLPLAGGRPQGA
jgi:two-component system sensor histidine kinase MprB